MTKHQQSINSTIQTKQFSVRQLLRSAIAAGVVAGFANSATAQTELTLPAFPEDSVTLTLPVPQDASSFVFAEPKQPTVSTSQRVAMLLGIKKQTLIVSLPQALPALALPSFPSTEPHLPEPQMPEPLVVPAQVSADTHAPTIFRSTGGKKISSQSAQFSDAIVLASADEAKSEEESLTEVMIPPNATVQTVAATTDALETESLDVSLSELMPEATETLSETLTDIAIPTNPVQVLQRLPDLVKRSPAMQLHIGGGVSDKPTISVTAASPTLPTNFTMSDAGDSDSEKDTSSEKAKIHKTISNVMNVRIEGEPAQVVARPAAAMTVTPAAMTLTSREPIVEPQKKPTFDSATYNAGQKTLSDKGTDRPPTIGERLEVDLHESANVETTQPISGLSVEHPELCQVLKSGERSVSFVGLKPGQTRVALFTTSSSGERKIEIREVVIAGAETRQADMKSLAAEISKSVHRMYPNSRIEVIAEAEGLTVQGYAGSESEAKKIIGLVRRTSLQPVVDRLATYK